jgi:hypothetical protein
MNRIKTMLAIAAIALSAIACEKNDLSQPEELKEVNANNISGKWQLHEWDGAHMLEGTYVYLDIVRNGQTYTMYQNIDSFGDIPHVITGRYFIETDPAVGAVIRGDYDHDSGDWAHRYIVKDLTATSMTWVAKDNPEYIQKYERVESIPVE